MVLSDKVLKDLGKELSEASVEQLFHIQKHVDLLLNSKLEEGFGKYSLNIRYGEE